MHAAPTQTDPFNNPRNVVCIYCNYERDAATRDQRCPECGRVGLVFAADIGRRTRTLIWVNRAILATLILLALGLGSRLGAGTIGPGLPLLALGALGAGLGLAGVLVHGSVIDRPAIRRNRALRRLVWPGLLGSILAILMGAGLLGLGLL